MDSELIFAVENNDIDKIKLLLENGINVNAKDKQGNTALMIASHKGYHDIVKFLLKMGANVNLNNNDKNTALTFASNNRHTDIVELLLNAGANPNAENNKKSTSLILASGKGYREIAQLLLNAGANPNLENNIKTPLMIASDKGHLDTVRLLLESGADPNAQNIEGNTPLKSAANNGHLEIVRLLLEAGADPNAEDISGDNALILAARNKHTRIVELLETFTSPSSLQYYQESIHIPLTPNVPLYSLTQRPITTLKRVMGFSPPKTQLVQEEYEVDYTRLKRKRPALILNEVDSSKSVMSGRIRIKGDYGFYSDEIAIPVVRYGKGPFHGALGAINKNIEDPHYTWYFIEPESDFLLFVNKVLITEYKSHAIFTMLMYLIAENREREDLLEYLYNPMVKYQKDLEEFIGDSDVVEQNYISYRQNLIDIINITLSQLQQREYTLQDIVTEFSSFITKESQAINTDGTSRYPSLDSMQFRERLVFEYGRQIGLNAIVLLFIDEVVDLRPRTISFKNIYKVVPDASLYVKKSYSKLHRRLKI